MKPVPNLSFLAPLTRRGAIVVAAIIYIVFALSAYQTHPQRVGDGSEYYAMYGEVMKGHRPFMTQEGWDAYSALYKKGRIVAMVPPEGLQQTFPPLIQKSGADFNHFWMYPALAALSGGWTATIGKNAHAGFLALHALLFACLAFIAAREFGRAGLLAVGILLIGSPMLWFVDKVHTEFLTFCCVSAASILFVRRKFLGAAAWLALASTQNISIGATAVFALLVGAWQFRKSGMGWRDIALLVLTLILVALHPTYYFFRVGYIDPQLLAGGAKIGANLSSMYAWFIDPDIGLFPNWPLGALLLVAGVVLFARRPATPDLRLLGFFAVFLITNLFAQSSTENINSGATIDVARYGTWYIGLFAPLLVTFMARLVAMPRRLWAYLAGALTLMASAANAYVYRPPRPESYLTPTRFSYWIQSTFPSLYNPPVQVFTDRNLRSVALPASYIILGPKCAKAVVVSAPGQPLTPFARNYCGMDPAKLPTSVLKPQGSPIQLPGGRTAYYVVLSQKEIKAAQAQFKLGEKYLTTDASLDGQAFLSDGWNAPEAWGVWSEGDHSQISGGAPMCRGDHLVIDLESNAYITPKNKEVKLTASVKGHVLGSHNFTGPTERVRMDIPCSLVTPGERLTIDLNIEGSISPWRAIKQPDDRRLGIGLQSFILEDPSDGMNNSIR